MHCFVQESPVLYTPLYHPILLVAQQQFNSLLYLVLLLLIFPQLVLRDNDLIELPKEIAQMTKLKELHIQNNRLTLLPPELGMFPCALSFICSSEVGVVCL